MVLFADCRTRRGPIGPRVKQAAGWHNKGLKVPARHVSLPDNLKSAKSDKSVDRAIKAGDANAYPPKTLPSLKRWAGTSAAYGVKMVGWPSSARLGDLRALQKRELVSIAEGINAGRLDIIKRPMVPPNTDDGELSMAHARLEEWDCVVDATQVVAQASVGEGSESDDDSGKE